MTHDVEQMYFRLKEAIHIHFVYIDHKSEFHFIAHDKLLTTITVIHKLTIYCKRCNFTHRSLIVDIIGFSH